MWGVCFFPAAIMPTSIARTSVVSRVFRLTLAAPRTTEAQTEQLEGPDIAEGGLLRQDNVDDPVMWYVVMLNGLQTILSSHALGD